MEILFVSSGNNKFGLSPIVKNQGESLKKAGVNLDYFTIQSRGIFGYLKNMFRLRHMLKNNSYHLVHAHYSLSGIVALLAGSKPLVVSLMGSDIGKNKIWKWIVKVFSRYLWTVTIVKSKRMKQELGIRKSKIIPSGIDLERFVCVDKEKAQKRIGFDRGKKHISFFADPNRPEKNIKLAKKAFDLIRVNSKQFNVIKDKPQELIPYYMNATDVLLLTSFREGSPNVIKEAMACNLPIVSTDVGDVKEVIGKTKGCYISTFNPEDVLKKIEMALRFEKRTNGRNKIKHLDNDKIAIQIISVYKDILSRNTNTNLT